MRITDLRTVPEPRQTDSCDVCIIGAGAAGLYLGLSLCKHLRVVVLEAGGEVCVKGKEIGIEATFSAEPYGGAVNGRAFGLGGTTSLWGGQLLPYSSHDVRSGSPYAEVWSHLVSSVQAATPDVYDALGLGQAGDFTSLGNKCLGNYQRSLANAGFSILASDWLPFRRRNFEHLLSRGKRVDGSLRIYVNAVACRWEVKENARPAPHLSHVTARSINGKEVTVAAGTFLITAGAIESARILLEIFNQTLLERRNARNVGHYLSDHLSAPIATVSRTDAKIIRSVFAPRFVQGRMRTFRLVDTVNEGSNPGGFFHFVFLHDDTGFHLARKVFAGLQARQIPDVGVVEVIRGLQGIAGLAYARFVRQRLFVPENTPVQLQFDMEQSPSFENCIYLLSERDEYGRLKAAIRWQVSAEDQVKLERTSGDFLRRWPTRSLRMEGLRPTRGGKLGDKLYETYHPVGTCRMGVDSDAVVDRDLKVHGLSNAYIVSTGVFPTAGSANPTFSLLCLAEQLAKQLKNCER